jgi:hypothetical protein
MTTAGKLHHVQGHDPTSRVFARWALDVHDYEYLA